MSINVVGAAKNVHGKVEHKLNNNLVADRIRARRISKLTNKLEKCTTVEDQMPIYREIKALSNGANLNEELTRYVSGVLIGIGVSIIL